MTPSAEPRFVPGPPTNGLSMLEIASGIVFGFDGSTPEPVRRDATPRAALERAMLPALRRSPCGVSFSGGRDSSAVLAVATATARRHGIEEPIPITLRFPGVASTNEANYQESVIRHLNLTDWLRIEPGESLDVLGDVSTNLTRRHGMLYPGNVHFVVPMAAAIPGGALLSGLGGDEVLGGHRHHALAEALVGQRRPSGGVARAFVKRYVLRHRSRNRVRPQLEALLSWLTPDARNAVVSNVLDSTFHDLLFADHQLTRRTFRRRYLRRAAEDITRVAADYDVASTHPLLDPGFVAAVAGELGHVGRATRTDNMMQLFGDALPQAIVERETKATFDDVFWTDVARAAISSLSVEGVLCDYVDEAALYRLWRSDELKGNTFLIAKYLRVVEDTRPAG